MKVTIAGMITKDQPMLIGTKYAIIMENVLYVNPDGYPEECCIIAMPKTEYTLSIEFVNDDNLLFRKNVQRFMFPRLFTPKQ